MGAGLKKDLRVSRVGPRRSLVQVQDGPAVLGKRIEDAYDSFMHALLGSRGYNSVSRALLLQIGCCDYGGKLLSIVGLDSRISRGGLRGGGLSCGGCQQFESTYLQLVNLADTKAKTVEWCTLDGESPVAESITSLCSDPSSMGHVESRVNQQGSPCKAKYSWMTDSEVVPGEMALESRASRFSPKCNKAQQLTGHLENPMPRKPMGSFARFIHGGESGPKIRLKGVGDGQHVNIPVLPLVGPEGRRRLG
ncbi:hypothetical protein Syun_021285 [Stephania yunnanensis]|uniref:Uncharacterized protein n=1 Tax=Stephania yunnanensis TaxID=152371 RepID=A0AAP0NPM3_9MAGN